MANVEYLYMQYYYLYGIVFLKIIFAPYEAGVKLQLCCLAILYR